MCVVFTFIFVRISLMVSPFSVVMFMCVMSTAEVFFFKLSAFGTPTRPYLIYPPTIPGPQQLELKMCIVHVSYMFDD